MEKKEYQDDAFESIDDIDKALAEEFPDLFGEPADELDKDTPAKTVEPTADPIPVPEPIVEKIDEPAAPTKPTQEDKQGHAFAELRRKAAETEAALAQRNAILESMAKTSGFKSVDEYTKAIQEKLLETEAKAKGVAPDVYKRMTAVEAELEQLRGEKTTRERAGKLENFKSSLDKVVQQYGLSDADKELVIARLDEQNYTLDMLLSVPQPDALIRGVLFDKIEEKLKLAKASTQAKKLEGVDTQGINSAQATPKTLDQILDEEMQAYAKSRNIALK